MDQDEQFLPESIPPPTCISDALGAVRECLVEQFGVDATELTPLCLNKAGFPLGFDHSHMLQELVGASLPASTYKHVQLAYVFLAAYYFLLDALVDEHASSPLHAVRLTQLKTAFWLELDSTSSELSKEGRNRRNILIREYVLSNARAVVLEKRLQASPLLNDESKDRESIVGRGNSFILFYELICLLAKRPPSEDVITILQELIYAIQMSDDLVDWESDYRGDRWTALLRRCFSHKGRLLTFGEVEEEIYIKGVFEEEIGLTIRRLDAIAKRLRTSTRLSSKLLQAYISRHKANLTQCLRFTVANKLNHAFQCRPAKSS